MRITDDRYTQQRHCLEIALRMTSHEARSSTIRDSTGLSEDRIRKLHRAYLRESGITPDRKRGKSPQQIHCLTHNLKTRIDATVIAGLMVANGLLEEIRISHGHAIDARIAARICDVYELFIEVRPQSRANKFSIEHAWLLARVLVAGTEMICEPCAKCGGLAVKDLFAPPQSLCALCEAKRLADRKRTRRRKKPAREAIGAPTIARSGGSGASEERHVNR